MGTVYSLADDTGNISASGNATLTNISGAQDIVCYTAPAGGYGLATTFSLQIVTNGLFALTSSPGYAALEVNGVPLVRITLTAGINTTVTLSNTYLGGGQAVHLTIPELSAGTCEYTYTLSGDEYENVLRNP